MCSISLSQRKGRPTKLCRLLATSALPGGVSLRPLGGSLCKLVEMQNAGAKAWFGSGSVVKILNGLNKQEFFSYHCRGRQMSMCGALSPVSVALNRPDLS